jgi:hypothetical protein
MRVEYISRIMPPFGIKRYKYYNVVNDENNLYVINDFGEKLEYTLDQMKEMYRLEVGIWDDLVKKSDNILEENVEEEITVAEHPKKQKNK